MQPCPCDLDPTLTLRSSPSAHTRSNARPAAAASRRPSRRRRIRRPCRRRRRRPSRAPTSRVHVRIGTVDFCNVVGQLATILDPITSVTGFVILPNEPHVILARHRILLVTPLTLTPVVSLVPATTKPVAPSTWPAAIAPTARSPATSTRSNTHGSVWTPHRRAARAAAASGATATAASAASASAIPGARVTRMTGPPSARGSPA